MANDERLRDDSIPILEPLEPRVLLNADPLGVVPSMASQDPAADPQAIVVDWNQGNEPVPEVSPVTHDQMYAGVDVQASSGPELLTSDILGLPSSYDLRVYGDVTSVKDQGAAGSCWAFATYGSLESTILVDTGVASDLSENHLKNYHGFDLNPISGGNYYTHQESDFGGLFKCLWDGSRNT